MREGISADFKLIPMLLIIIITGGQEHPCDRCNWDRKVCRGYPRLDSIDNEEKEKDDDDIFGDRGDNCWIHDPDMGDG